MMEKKEKEKYSYTEFGAIKYDEKIVPVINKIEPLRIPDPKCEEN